LAAADGKPKIAAHHVGLENGTVELALQVLAPRHRCCRHP
jgi:hypothetical protein